MTLEVERLKLPGSGSRIYEATYFSNQFPSTPASCCLAIDDYHRNSELCATESSERTEYEYNPENGVCTQNVITSTVFVTDDDARTVAGSLPDVTISTELDSAELCCAAAAEAEELDEILI